MLRPPPRWMFQWMPFGAFGKASMANWTALFRKLNSSGEHLHCTGIGSVGPRRRKWERKWCQGQKGGFILKRHSSRMRRMPRPGKSRPKVPLPESHLPDVLQWRRRRRTNDFGHNNEEGFNGHSMNGPQHF